MLNRLITVCLLAAAAWAVEPHEAKVAEFMTAYFPTHPDAAVTLEAKDRGASYTVYYAKWALADKKGGDLQPLILLHGSRTLLVGQYFNLAKFKDETFDERFLGEFLSRTSGSSMKVAFLPASKETQEMEILQETGFGKVKLEGFLVGRTHLLVGNRYSLDGDPRQARLAAIDPARGGTRGTPTAPRKLYIFLDLECPHCAKLEAELAPLLRGRDDIAATFFQFPLTAGHPLAFKAAAAALCYLGEGGSPLYLEFMDYFFPLRSDLDLSSVDGACYGFAEQRGLEEKFLSCYMQEANIREVLSVMQMGVDAGVGYTPAVYLDGAAYRPQDIVALLKPPAAAEPAATGEPARP